MYFIQLTTSLAAEHSVNPKEEKIQEKELNNDQQERKVIDDLNEEEIHNIQPNSERVDENYIKPKEKTEDESDFSKQKNDVKETPVVEQELSEPQTNDSRKGVENEVKRLDSEEESSQSFLSFRNFLNNLVNPVLEELEKGEPGARSDIRMVNEVSQNQSVSNNATNASVPLTTEIKNKSEKKSKFTCVGKNYTAENASVMIVNNTQLLSILSFDNNNTEGDCVLVLFFVPYCRFCAAMAPSFNALARVYPQLNIIAVDAAQFSNLNAKFGTVSVPNILLFHQSRAVVRFNSTEKSFTNLVSFVKNSTGFEPNITVNVTSEDLSGPLPSVAMETTDYMLLVSWLFVIFCSGFMFVQSSLGQQWINKVNMLWQEHQHIDQSHHINANYYKIVFVSSLKYSNSFKKYEYQ